eukprot:503135-Amphidinium_carterae.1
MATANTQSIEVKTGAIDKKISITYGTSTTEFELDDLKAKLALDPKTLQNLVEQFTTRFGSLRIRKASSKVVGLLTKAEAHRRATEESVSASRARCDDGRRRHVGSADHRRRAHGDD